MKSVRRVAEHAISAGLAMALIFGLASACTAYVALSLPEDPPEGGKASSSSGSTGSSGVLPKCSLLNVTNTTSSRFEVDAAHPCIDCITENCKGDLDYACVDGEEKPWFSNIRSCGQEPAVAFGSSFYGCSRYEKDTEVVTGSSEAAKESQAEQCIHTNCMQETAGGPPACRTCPIYVNDQSSSSQKHYLSDPESACGKCLSDNCAKELSRCCKTKVISGHVTYCAFTDDSTFRTNCKDLRDGGKTAPADPTDEEDQCDFDVRKCYQTKCQGSCP